MIASGELQAGRKMCFDTVTSRENQAGHLVQADMIALQEGVRLDF